MGFYMSASKLKEDIISLYLFNDFGKTNWNEKQECEK